MTLTTHIRFVDPVDPRAVWDAAQEIVGVPNGYHWEVFPANQRREHSGLVFPNAEWSAPADQGANALMWMWYGHEGGRLLDDPEEPEIEPGPPAYVELCLDTPYGAAVDHRPWIAALQAQFPGALWWQGECCADWHDQVDA